MNRLFSQEKIKRILSGSNEQADASDIVVSLIDIKRAKKNLDADTYNDILAKYKKDTSGPTLDCIDSSKILGMAFSIIFSYEKIANFNHFTQYNQQTPLSQKLTKMYYIAFKDDYTIIDKKRELLRYAVNSEDAAAIKQAQDEFVAAFKSLEVKTFSFALACTYVDLDQGIIAKLFNDTQKKNNQQTTLDNDCLQGSDELPQPNEIPISKDTSRFDPSIIKGAVTCCIVGVLLVGVQIYQYGFNSSFFSSELVIGSYFMFLVAVIILCLGSPTSEETHTPANNTFSQNEEYKKTPNSYGEKTHKQAILDIAQSIIDGFMPENEYDKKTILKYASQMISLEKAHEAYQQGEDAQLVLALEFIINACNRAISDKACHNPEQLRELRLLAQNTKNDILPAP